MNKHRRCHWSTTKAPSCFRHYWTFNMVLKKYIMYHVASALPLFMFKYSVQILFDITYHYPVISFISFHHLPGFYFIHISMYI